MVNFFLQLNFHGALAHWFIKPTTRGVIYIILSSGNPSLK